MAPSALWMKVLEAVPLPAMWPKGEAKAWAPRGAAVVVPLEEAVDPPAVTGCELVPFPAVKGSVETRGAEPAGGGG